MLPLSSARRQVAGLFGALACLFAGAVALAEGQQSYTPSYHQPSYQPPSYQPPVYQPPSYTPRVPKRPTYQPPKYTPPTYTPPPYRPPSYYPPKVHKPRKVVHKYKSIGEHRDVGTRVFYVPVPHYQERIVEVEVEKKVYVEKPVKVTKYWVKEVHYGRCVFNGPAVVHAKPSHSTTALGAVPLSTKLHIKQRSRLG